MAVDKEEAGDLRRLANVIAMLLIKDMKKGEAAETLRRAGFSTKDIAALTATTESSVRGMLSVRSRRPSAAAEE